MYHDPRDGFARPVLSPPQQVGGTQFTSSHRRNSRAKERTMSHHCLIHHHWTGCLCERCGQVRDTEHRWEGCRCPQCGLVRDEGHDWESVHCRLKCRRCGRVGRSDHAWTGCVCARCGAHHPEATAAEHDWEGCLCRRCGAGRHRWVLGVCQVCAEHCRHPVVDSSWDTHDSGGTVTGEGERSCRACGLRLGKVPLKGG